MNVGIIGAGVMGAGVAQTLAQFGNKVVLVDISDEILNRAKQEIITGIRFQALLGKAGTAIGAEEVLSDIVFTVDYSFLGNVDFVIENVTEKWEIKKKVYSDIDAICPKHCVFAANTSAISITRIASLTQRPEKVIGIHFMNPVPMKSTVEVIKGYHTSEDTIEKAKNLLGRMGKEGIIVHDYPGFVSNRVLMLTINEAIWVIQDQVAVVEDVDRIFTQCFGHKMGPLETADLIGLDTILNSIQVLYDSYNDSKYRPCPLLVKMVDAGLLGRKSGQGFYNYKI